ncbi:uncharacterized protein Pyn_39447 [Prunus yedoensis var. nudiflora]|uniref:Uncharacterized protein n=1 Tax=Prunus yedoensis var. nudiflora TaxID=2094558 RepID=A0A314Z4L2_PRUYE|nr:uncharacterized protein Pyn_39447 [Prunus yedoensis var. nudiflora]
MYFSDVYYHNKGNYEENALGTFLYSRNTIAHVNDHVKAHFFEENKGIDREEIPKQLQGLLMSEEQVVERLTSFFPHMLVDVYKFLVEEGFGAH